MKVWNYLNLLAAKINIEDYGMEVKSEMDVAKSIMALFDKIRFFLCIVACVVLVFNIFKMILAEDKRQEIKNIGLSVLGLIGAFLIPTIIQVLIDIFG